MVSCRSYILSSRKVRFLGQLALLCLNLKSNAWILENDLFNSSIIKRFQFVFFFMLIMFDFNQVVQAHCVIFFPKTKIIHKSKNEIHKNRTLGKKPVQSPAVRKCCVIL